MLEVATDTVTRMLCQHDWFASEGQKYVSMDMTALHHTRQHLAFQLQMMQSLKARSEANEKRLHNEIALVKSHADRAATY